MKVNERLCLTSLNFSLRVKTPVTPEPQNTLQHTACTSPQQQAKHYLIESYGTRLRTSLPLHLRVIGTSPSTDGLFNKNPSILVSSIILVYLPRGAFKLQL